MIKLLILSLLLAGCSIEDHYTKNKADKAFDSMCERQTLYICGDDVKINHYNTSGVKALYNFEYLADGKDIYTYIYSDDEGIYRGDCEDYVITFIEDNIVGGYIDNAKWVIGEFEGRTHAWAIVDDNLYDTAFITGIPSEIAYSKFNYKRIGTVYEW